MVVVITIKHEKLLKFSNHAVKGANAFEYVFSKEFVC